MATLAPYEDTRWYVVQTRPHQENRASSHLARQGFRTFLPTYQRTIRHGRRFRNSVSPLFPRYLFVQFSANRDRWRSINGTQGVCRLVAAGEEPLAVPEGAIEEMISSDGSLPVATVAEGAPIKIATGPFAGLTGKLLHLDPDGRVKVLLSILGGDVPLTVESRAVFPAA